MLTLLRQLSLRHMRRTPGRSILVILGIALGVAMYVATSAANASISAAFADMVKRVAGRADLVVIGRGAGLSSEHTGEIAQIDGVAHAAAVVEIPIRELETGEPLLVLGVDFLGDTYFLPFDVAQGEQRVVEDPLAFVNDPKAILVANSLAVRRKLKVGDPLRLLTAEGAKDFVVRGVMQDAGPAAAFGGQVAVMFIDAAQVSFSRGNLVDRIDVALAPGADLETVRTRIAEKVGPSIKVERPSQKLERITRLMGPFQTGVTLSGLVSLVVGMFLVYNAVGISVAQRRREIGIVRSIGATRRSVIAAFCLEAMSLALPAIAIGIVFARFIARLALQQTAPTITRMYAPVRAPDPALTLDLVLRGVIVGLAATLFAAFWPARRAAEVEPVESIRPPSTAITAEHVPWRGMLVASALAGAGAWFLGRFGPALASASSIRALNATPMLGGGVAVLLLMVAAALAVPGAVVGLRASLVRPIEALFGVPGRLGLDNVERSLGRSALDVVALMVAVALSMAVGTWLLSFKQNVTATIDRLVAGDVQITAGSPITDQYNVPFSPAALEKLRGVPGVESVLPTRILEQELNGQDLIISALDSRAYLAHLERRKRMPELSSGTIVPTALSEAPRMVINEHLAHRLKLKSGDVLELDAPKGKARFEIVAVTIDYAQGPIAYIDRKYALESWGDESIDIIDLVLAPGSDPEAVTTEVRKRLGNNELLFVTRLEAMKAELGKTIEQAFVYSRSVEGVALLIALLGVLGTLTAAVLDRTRELGMLRAIGATRTQVARTVVAEAAFLGLSAAATGIVFGSALAALFLTIIESAGAATRLGFVFSGPDALRIAALVVTTAALAGVFPARRAARMDVKEALSYE